MTGSLFRKFIEEPDFSPQSRGEKWLAVFLRLAAVAYGSGVGLRNWAYQVGFCKVQKLPLPVISVGNLTVGGTGKTPLVAWLAGYFREKGLKPCILSRGYGRKAEQEILLQEGGRGPYDYTKLGDEPVLLAQKLPGVLIALGARRYEAAQAALKKYPLDLFLLDDGFQHQKLHRDLNILLVDSTHPWGNGYLFPGGALREPKNSLARADCLVLTKAQKDKDYQGLKAELKCWNPGAPVMLAGYKSRALRQINGSMEITPDKLFDQNVLAFAGIAQPRSFQSTLLSLGAKVIKYIIYPDHYPYSSRDVTEIVQAAQAAEADLIVTTEKDAVRLGGMELSHPFWALRVEMEILEGREYWETLLRELMIKKS